MRYLRETRDRLVEKRKRRAERDGIDLGEGIGQPRSQRAVGVGETSGRHEHEFNGATA